jgi:hypothetical protein
MSNVKHISYYTNIMQNWSKPLGPKPSEAELALAHVHGRPGKQSFIVAMALRPDGVTRAQMLEASGLYDGKPTPQLNHMRALVTSHMMTRLPVPGAYALQPGPNHAQYAALYAAEAADKVEAETPAKPAKKAKGKAKAKKATPAAQAETPVSEPVQVTAPAPEMQATA